MHHFFRHAVLAAAMACAAPAFAAPVTLHAGQELVWNVDLTNMLPGAPPFSSVRIGNDTSNTTATGSWELFAEHDMQGAMFDSVQALNLSSLLTWEPAARDGIFSVRVAVTSGSVDLDLWASGDLNGVGSAVVRWEPDAIEVPEPATLSLACLGLLTAATMRRRALRCRRHPRNT